MLNPLEMESYIHAVASRADMKVVWEKDNEIPRTNGKTIWLPHITANMTIQQYATLKHYVAHEVDHVRFTDFKAVKNEPTCQEGIYGACLNMVEDLRVEKKGSEEYLGDRLNSGNVQSERIGVIGTNMHKHMKEGGPAQEMIKSALPLLDWSHKHWTNMYPAVAGSAGVFEEACADDPDSAKYKARFDKSDYDAVLKNLSSTADAVKLAERIAREVYEVDPDEERRKAQKQRKQKAKAEEVEGENDGQKDGNEGEVKGEGESKDKKEPKGKGDKGKMGKGGDKPRDREMTVDYTNAMLDPHDQPGMSRHGLHIKYKDSDFDVDYYSPAKADDYRVWKRDETESSSLSGTHRHCDAEELIQEMKGVIRRTNPNFAHKVRIVLQVRAKDKVQYGMKRGQLNQGSLHRLAVDSPHYAERVFKRKVTSDVLDSCVFLLVDQSGSMSGAKFIHAAVAAAMMNEVVGNVLHIPTYIASFTDFGVTPSGNGERQNIFIHRSWQDQLLNNESLLASFARAANQGMCNNADGDAVMWAYNKIAGQKQRRKLIIVFSDGQPAGGCRGNVAWYTKHVVQGIEKETPVNIVGIGIQDKNVSHIYKEHYVIHEVSKLEEALLSTIERKLK